MNLIDLFKDVDVKFLNARHIEIPGISNDSRKIQKGYAFFAITGAKNDGNLFIEDAISRGAVAIVKRGQAAFSLPDKYPDIVWILVKDVLQTLSRISARFYGEPSSKLRVIGITGTNGKTTTTYFLESIYSVVSHKPGVIGTVDYRIDGKNISKASNTTPLAHDLHWLLRTMLDAGSKVIIMEVSSHSLALKRVDKVHFDCAVFTNLARDHLDFHKDRESYFRAKMKLFELLAFQSDKKDKWAILNSDDEKSARIIKKLGSKINICTYGIDSKADFKSDKIEIYQDMTFFKIKTPKGDYPVQLNLPGKHNIYNAICAISAAFSMGLDMETAIKGVELVKNVPGRLEKISLGQDFLVFVDYAHTDGALENILGNLKKLPHDKIITVFGCGGDRDRTKRPAMGKIACSLSDFVLITNDNPRTEDPDRIFDDIKKVLKDFSNYTIIPDRKHAIFTAIKTAKKNDIVLIAGKGHEDYQILKDRTIHFDDREIAKEAIKAVKSK
jgi:UDP-N-acetylmuramyl-tripeptide synthetase